MALVESVSWNCEAVCGHTEGGGECSGVEEEEAPNVNLKRKRREVS